MHSDIVRPWSARTSLQFSAMASADSVAVDQTETDHFLKSLEPFPHLYQLQGYKDLRRARLKSIRDRLKAERKEIEQRNGDVDYGRMQRSRDSNVIAFTSFRLDDYDTAKSESERVLQDDAHNIVTLANLAVFSWERGSRVEAEESLQRLKELSDLPDFGDRCVEAKAELAYCYSRMGPSYTGLAVSRFEEVVELRPLEYDWKLGLGMTLTRVIHPNQRMSNKISGKAATQKAYKAVDLFLEVKQSAVDTLKAQAAIQLGLLLTCQTGKDYGLQNRIKQYCKLKSVFAQQCFEDALRLVPNDSSILTRCGRYFYRNEKYQKSQEVLEKAIVIRPTAIAHGVLGQVFSKMVYKYMNENSTHTAKKADKKHKGKFRNGRRPQGSRVTDRGDMSSSVSSSSMPDITDCQEAIDILKAAKLPQEINIAAGNSIFHLWNSIKLSHGDNDNARFNLARLYMELGGYHAALLQFEQLMGQQKCREFPSNRIGAYELAAKCNLKLSELQRDCRKKQELAEKAHKLFKLAFSFQCHYARQVPVFKDHFGKWWHSFETLMTEIQKDTTSPDKEKLKEKARLLHTMGEYTGSLKIIGDIAQYNSQEAADPEFLRMKLDCYMCTKQYDEAVVLMCFLQCQRHVIQNWDTLCAQTHILAARQALLAYDNTSAANANTEDAKAYFVLAFDSLRPQPSVEQENGNNDRLDTTQTYAEDDGDDRGQPEYDWHVIILYDPEDLDTERKAATIKGVLKDICGLRVTCMMDDIHPGALERLEILNSLEKSLLAILMVDAEDRQNDTFRQMYLEPTLEALASGNSCLRKVFMLMTDGERPPSSLRLGRLPYFRCPPALLCPCGEDQSDDHIGGAGQSGAPVGGDGQSGAPVGGDVQSGAPVGGDGQSGVSVGGDGQSGAPVGGDGQSGAPVGGDGQCGAPVGGDCQSSAPVGGEGQSDDLPSPCGDDRSGNAETIILPKEKVLAICRLFSAMLGVSIKEFPY